MKVLFFCLVFLKQKEMRIPVPAHPPTHPHFKKKKQTNNKAGKEKSRANKGRREKDLLGNCRTPKEHGESQLKFSPYNLLNNTAQSSRKAVQPFVSWD